MNRYFTLLLVPEKTSAVKRVVIPAWVLKSGAVVFATIVLIFLVMIYNYGTVMSQVSENRELKFENRKLRQQVQVFENKISTIESTLDRVKTFTTRLKVITNLSDRDSLLQTLNENPPDATTNIGDPEPSKTAKPASELTLSDWIRGEGAGSLSPDEWALKRDFERLEDRLASVQNASLEVELSIQDQYELLVDQRAYLAALPTRRPAVGYFTSGFGVRKSPIGGIVKMHEGTDITNAPGTTIRATADGVVLFSDTKAGYGRTVIIDHGYGIETWYGHAQRLVVKKGDRVRRGDTIALMGSSGRSTGPHVHYEVRVRGTPVDPRNYILEN